MRRTAWIYIITVWIGAGLLGLANFVARPDGVLPVWLFMALTLVTAALMVFVIFTPSHRAYEGSTIGFISGIFLLPPWLFVLQVIFAHGIEWFWVRFRNPSSSHLRAWYIQPFNMSKCIISGAVSYYILSLAPVQINESLTITHLTVILLTIITYVTVNQVILGLVLSLARGFTFREAGIFRDAILIEIPLSSIGYVSVELLHRNPLAVLFILAPIALIYQAFMLPKVQDDAVKALEGVNSDLSQANQSILRLNAELFRTLAKVFDMRDPYVGGHAAQVAKYAVAIATEMGLPGEQIEVIRQSAYMHDIGKLAIPEVILHKPARLTETEYEFIKRHSDIGADLLAATEGMSHLAEFVRHHHEHWDGGGYPMRLAGEEIPLESRILNLCDSVEAMASDRPYHRSMNTRQIVAEIQRQAGKQFDPAVVDVFVRLVGGIGAGLVVNSARTVAEQLAASILVSESLSQRLFDPLLTQES